MAQNSLIQVRVEDSLKKEADALYCGNGRGDSYRFA